MEKFFTVNKKFYLMVITLFLITDLFLVIDKKASLMTLLLVILIFLKQPTIKNNFNFFYLEKNFNTTLVFIYLLILTFLTQNYLLNFEIIDWDISSYLVASNSIYDGFLPYEKQWESKGPILFYIYGALIKLTSGNYIYFKLLNDVVLSLIAFILYLSVKTRSGNYLSIFSSTLFILIFSQPWALSGYSEIYCLIFIALSYLLDTKEISYKYYLIGFLMSVSTLVNQGSILFALPFVIKYLSKKNFYKFFQFFIGSFIPYIFFITIFSINDLMDVFLTTYITIPIEYTSASYTNFYELRVFLRKYFEFNSYIYYLFISVVFVILFTVYKNKKNKFSDIWFDSLFILISLAFYFIGAHNYYHHLLFLLFFISLFVQNFTKELGIYLLTIFLILSLSTSLFTLGKKSVEYLSNIENIYANYPIKKLAKEVDSYFDRDYEVFALEYNLILHYLGKNNSSYIVHHTNFLEPYIMSALEDIGYIEKDYIKFLLEKKPDVVICSEWMIVRGDPIKNPIVNCSNDIFDKSYVELDTEKYFTDNLNYYFDPYKKIKVFIKTN